MKIEWHQNIFHLMHKIARGYYLLVEYLDFLILARSTEHGHHEGPQTNIQLEIARGSLFLSAGPQDNQQRGSQAMPSRAQDNQPRESQETSKQ